MKFVLLVLFVFIARYLSWFDFESMFCLLFVPEIGKTHRSLYSSGESMAKDGIPQLFINYEWLLHGSQ